MTSEQAWRLFLATGLPEAYVLARRRREQEEQRRKRTEQPGADGIGGG